MKKDKLEQFISDHRSEFDSDNPPPMVWMNLEKALGKEEETEKKPAYAHELKWPSIMRIMQVAAMFIVVMGVGLIIGMQINSNQPYNNPQLKEFAEAEKHYSKKIDNMWSVVKASGIDYSIEQDLKSLDDVYNELRSELLSGDGGNTEEVVNAMIQNYRTKIEILETVLFKKNNDNQQIDLEDGKVEI